MISETHLEYNKVIALIAAECHSEFGKELVRALKPKTDINQIKEHLDLCEEVIEIQKHFFDLDFEYLFPLELILDRPTLDILTYEEFKDIYHTAQKGNEVISRQEETKDFKRFTRKVKSLTELPNIEKRFTQIYDPQGEILDNASPQLSAIRKRQRQVRENIVGVLGKKLRDTGMEKFLADKIVTQRDDRFVILLKDSSVSFVQGIVHDKSTTKSSVYFEPTEVIGLNNEVNTLKGDEKREIFRILREYTEEIFSVKSNLLHNCLVLQELDYFFGIGRYSRKIEARKPDILNEPKIKMVKARHPLLITRLGNISKVIPFDAELGYDYRLLLISGPNTGGKTITLKAIGLLTAMALSGLPICAGWGTEIGVFDNILADIGDNQSLENSLSTFAAHIENIKTMIQNGNSRSLVLIDEIGSATDPEQGSALAQAIIEELVRKQVLGVITTHYTSLKLFVEKTEGCINAAMHFDPEKHLPTYQFKLGLPGNSFAIEVASHLGLPEELIKRAQELTGQENIQLTELIRKVNEEKKNLSRHNYEMELKMKLMERKAGEYEQKINDFENEKKALKKKALQEASDYLTVIQRQLTEEFDIIKKEAKETKKSKLNDLNDLVQEYHSEVGEKLDTLKGNQKVRIKKPETGMKVWVKSLDAKATIAEINKDSSKVELNGIFFTVKNDDLFFNKEQPVFEQPVQNRGMRTETKEIKTELKLLGLTFEEALPLLEAFLDDAMLAGLNKVRVVNGKGTGVLRSKVRGYLRKNKKVVEFYTPAQEAGGDGVTVVSFN